MVVRVRDNSSLLATFLLSYNSIYCWKVNQKKKLKIFLWNTTKIIKNQTNKRDKSVNLRVCEILIYKKSQQLTENESSICKKQKSLVITQQNNKTMLLKKDLINVYNSTYKGLYMILRISLTTPIALADILFTV